MTELTLEQRIAKSSQVIDARYTAPTHELAVVFRHSQTRYHYSDVSPELWAALQAADSIGSWLHHNIKKTGHTFTKEAITREEYDGLVARNAAIASAIPVAADKP